MTFPMSSPRFLSRLLRLLAWSLLALVTRAGLPEPGLRLFGTVALDGVAITSNDTGVSVEVRKSPTGPAIATYQMGSLTNAGNFYSLKLDAESAEPLTDSNHVVLGATVHVLVLDPSGVRDQKTLVVGARGLRQRLDFGSPDTDGDGLSDAFELLFFANATAALPDLDSDGDGRPNLREFLQGTDPNTADGRHPADIRPADDRLTLSEVTDYILAWKTGATNWPVEPLLSATNIEDYITRAGALWKGGEFYRFTNSPPTNAPLWWVNASSTNGSSSSELAAKSLATAKAASAAVRRTLATAYRPNQSLPVTLETTAEDATRAYAVVESVPPGWSVRNLSHEGRWDPLQRKIKWGPFFDPSPRTFSYEAVPGPGFDGPARFGGRGSFDGRGESSKGPQVVWPSGRFPAPRLLLTTSPGVSVQLLGEAGRTYEVQLSTDLATWIAGPTTTLDDTGHGFVAVDNPDGARFYRLRALD